MLRINVASNVSKAVNKRLQNIQLTAQSQHLPSRLLTVDTIELWLTRPIYLHPVSTTLINK